MLLDWTGQLVLLITAIVANFFSAISGGGATSAPWLASYFRTSGSCTGL